jgi:nucleotide-binding universal stress UspA family protein
MFANILVPLDGSALSERALPFALSLAKATDGRLWLVHARPATVPLIDPEHGHDPGAMIEGIAAHLRERGFRVTSRTMHGDATNVILDASVDMPADLIVMATHGRGGIRRWLYGSVTDRVLLRASVPVMLVPTACDHPWPNDRRLKILVPLDGSDLSESVLGTVHELSHAIGADLLLMRAAAQEPGVPLVPWLEPVGLALHQATETELAEAREYLDGLAVPPGLVDRSVDVLVDDGEPSSSVPRIARQEDVDLIAMATHGRTGLARLTMGGVATATLQHAHVPVLLVRPKGLKRTTDEAAPERQGAAPPNVWPPIATG